MNKNGRIGCLILLNKTIIKVRNEIGLDGRK